MVLHLHLGLFLVEFLCVGVLSHTAATLDCMQKSNSEKYHGLQCVLCCNVHAIRICQSEHTMVRKA